MTSEETGEPALRLAGLRGVSRQTADLFHSGFHSEAVRHASQELINEVGRLAGRNDLDGEDLMHHAFSEQDPLLVLSERRTLTQRDQHAGFRYLLAGMARFVRNVLTHDLKVELNEGEALEILAFLSLLRRTLDQARPAASATGPDSKAGDERG